MTLSDQKTERKMEWDKKVGPVALQIDIGMQLLAICSGTTPEEVYAKLNRHMTDSVGNIKGIAEELQALYELDSKHGSLGEQALDMCLKLVTPEYSHKSWNYYSVFINFLSLSEALIGTQGYFSVCLSVCHKLFKHS